MNKSVNPLVALLVILFFGGLIGLNFYFNQHMLEVERPTFITNTPDGHLAIQFGRQLFLIDGDSGDEVVVDLDGLGFADNIGNFDFFDNGDLLLRLGAAPTSIVEAWDVVMRSTNHNYEQADGNFIARCQLGDRKCQEFSTDLPGFDRAFRVFIERDTDTVYLADTSRHRILKLDSTGKLLATAEGFKFPNQIALVNDKLWIADTNNHRFVAVSPKTESFGKVLSEIAITPDSLHIWPSAFVQVDRDWWVLAMGDNMSYGRVVRYTDTGVELDQLDMPSGADPLSLALWGDNILVADYGRLAFYRYDRRGVRQVDFSTPSLAALINEKRAEIERWRYAGYSCWAIFALGLLVGFVVAIRQQKQTIPEDNESLIESDNGMESVPATGIWIEASRAAKWLPYVLILMVVLLPVFALPVVWDEDAISHDVMMMSIFLALPLLLIARPMLKMTKMRLGIFPSHIELIDFSGQRHRTTFEDVYWNRQGACKVGDFVLPLGADKHGFFPQNEVQRWFVPRLLSENKVGDWTMMKYQWRSPEGLMNSFPLVIAVFCAMAIYLERDAVLEWVQALIAMV